MGWYFSHLSLLFASHLSSAVAGDDYNGEYHSRVDAVRAGISSHSDLDAGTPGSMKIGTEVLTATGVDATGKLGGTEFRGHGDLVTIDSGEAEGISIQLLPGYEDVWRTSLQVGGKVSVIDESLGLQFKNWESEIRHTFPKVDSNVLGLGSSNNRFGNLQEIDSTS